MRYTLSVLAIAEALLGQGQCATSIPSNATVIDNTSAATITADHQFFWACPQAYQQVFLGDHNTIWIEAGAIVGVLGDSSTVWYRGTIPLGVYGVGNIVAANAAAYVADQGTGTTIIDCSAEAISFDLSDAPLLGCTTTGLDRALPASPIIRFDASQGLLIIRPEVTDAQVTIMDVQGRLATHWMRTGADTIDLSHLPAGCYLVRVDGSSGPAMLRFTTI